MSHSRWFARYASALLLAATVAMLFTRPALADPAKLAPGAAFPTLEGDSVGGTHVTLPSDRRGAPFVVIFGFSQKGGDASTQWGEAIDKTFPNVALYAVADLSRVPGLFRGFVVSAIRHEMSSASPEEREHLLLLTHGNVWSQIVPSGSDDDAVIVAVDKTGTVADIERRPYTSDAAAQVTKALANLF
jgi:hypothetical protein